MREKFFEIGEDFSKSRESHTVHWLIIVSAIAIVSGLCGIFFIIFVYGTNPLLQSDDKYDVFVTLLLIFLTLLGLLGYGMYIWIGGKLESQLNERLEKEEQEIQNSRNLFRARIQRNMGYIFWKLFEVEKKKEEGKNTLVLNELITLAIERTEQSLKYAIKLPKNEYKEDRNKGKANWVYFLAEAARIKSPEVTNQDKEQALKFVNEILEEVSEQDCPDYDQYQESCAWALQHLSEEEDKNLKQKASDIIHELLKANIPSPSRKEYIKKWKDILEKEKDISTSIKNS